MFTVVFIVNEKKDKHPGFQEPGPGHCGFPQSQQTLTILCVGASLTLAVILPNNPVKCVLSAPFAAISLSKEGMGLSGEWVREERREGGKSSVS